MARADHPDIEKFLEGVKKRNPGQPEFVQAVQEVAQDIFPFIQDKTEYHEYQILRRIAEPDRVVSFRVCWEDDENNIRVHSHKLCGHIVLIGSVLSHTSHGVTHSPSMKHQ